MAAITITFTNATLPSTNLSIRLSGGSYDLSVADGLRIAGTIAFTSLAITSGAISFNVASGVTFDGQVVANVASGAAGRPPTVEVTNFVGLVTISWPTANGMNDETLEPSNPMPLSGYIG